MDVTFSNFSSWQAARSDWSLSIAGSNFLTRDSTSKAEQGSTACESSEWISDTMLWCKHAESAWGSRRVIVTAGWRPGTVTEALSFDVPLVRGNQFDTRIHFGSPTYNSASLPGGACSDGTTEVEFVPGYVYGCDGAWSGQGVLQGSSLCGAGFEMCPSADRVGALGLNATGCASLPPEGSFYATGESAALGEGCASDGTDGSGAGASGVWGCGKDGSGLVWGASTCGNLTHYLADEGSLSVGVWAVSDLAGIEKQGLTKGDGNGGTLCCRAMVSLPVGALNSGVQAHDSTTGSGFLMYSLDDVEHRFSASSSNAEHFIAVRYVQGQGWEYVGDLGLQQFSPKEGDLLVASVDFSSRKLTPLAPDPHNMRTHGVASGFKSLDLKFVIDSFGGSADFGEFEVSGTQLLVSPDTLDVRRLHPQLGELWAHLTYKSWTESGPDTWLDASGNGRHASVTRGTPVGSLKAGGGARAAVGTVSGAPSDGLRLAAFPAIFSVCLVSRYSGENMQRVFEGVDFDGVMGHADGKSGVIGLNGDIMPSSGSVTPATHWVVLCGRNEGNGGDVYFTANGIHLEAGNGEGTNDIIAWGVNDGYSDASSHSDWAVSEVLVWDTALSDAEVLFQLYLPNFLFESV